MPENRRRPGKGCIVAEVGAEAEAEPSVVLAGNAGVVVVVVAAAFVANASSDHRNRSWRTMRFVPGVVSVVAECSIVGCRQWARPQLTIAELELLQSSTQSSPGEVLLEEGREEEEVGADYKLVAERTDSCS